MDTHDTCGRSRPTLSSRFSIGSSVAVMNDTCVCVDSQSGAAGKGGMAGRTGLVSVMLHVQIVNSTIRKYTINRVKEAHP